MQAHPQSSPAARIYSTLHSTHLIAPPAPTQPRSRVLPAGAPSLLTAPPTSLADTAGLAHDAGNLLAALGLYCDLLSAPGVLRPEHRHYATELSLISNRSSELIRGLIATAHPTPPLPSNVVPAAPSSRHATRYTEAATGHASMLRNLAPILQQIAANAATVYVTCPANLPPFDVAPENLERIVVNLVRNAAQAIRSQSSSNIPPPRNEIRVALATVAGRLQLTVEDTGPGMPPAAAAAFLRPAPLPSGATRGLGHRIVHELVQSSRGQLSIRVRPGNGTVLCIKWPIPKSTHTGNRHIDAPSDTLASASSASLTSSKGPTTC